MTNSPASTYFCAVQFPSHIVKGGKVNSKCVPVAGTSLGKPAGGGETEKEAG